MKPIIVDSAGDKDTIATRVRQIRNQIEERKSEFEIEDALSATKAVVEEGIGAGGGIAYVNVIPIVEKVQKL